MCGCFQSVSNTVGTHISGRNERPGLSQQLHEGYCVPLVKGLACKRQCSCLLPSWLSLFPCGSPVSVQSLVSCQLEVWVVVSLEPQSYQNWSVPPLSLMVFWDLNFFPFLRTLIILTLFYFLNIFFSQSLAWNENITTGHQQSQAWQFQQSWEKAVLMANWIVPVIKSWRASWSSLGSAPATYHCSWQWRLLWLYWGLLGLWNLGLWWERGSPSPPQREMPQNNLRMPHVAGMYLSLSPVCPGL